MLKTQDIVVLIKVHCLELEWTYADLAESLKTSSSVVHDALHRCEECYLYNAKRRTVLSHKIMKVKAIFHSAIE